MPKMSQWADPKAAPPNTKSCMFAYSTALRELAGWFETHLLKLNLEK